MNGDKPSGGPRFRLVLDARELADHPELLAWASGPLAEAIAKAPFPVSILIARQDDELS